MVDQPGYAWLIKPKDGTESSRVGGWISRSKPG
jgi:hypothetical protein